MTTVGEASVTGTPTEERAAPPRVEAPMGATAAAPAAVIADPAPLGLAAFGITTLMLSCINAGWIGGTAAPKAVLALAIPFGGTAQLLAGMWAFRRGNTFAATAFSSFGAFWISYYLLCWGVFTTYMFLASLGSARAVQLVFILLAATFFLLAAGEWGDSTTWHHIGGYVGLATAIAALYTSFADVANANLKRTILPT
jgi:uncharacterized protein